MAEITIIATANKTPVSWLIRTITNFSYSHLGIKLSNTTMIDADWGGVKVRNIPKKYDEFVVKNIDTENFSKGVKWLFAQRGKSYDFIGVFITAIYNALGWKRKKNNLQDSDKYTCSEYIFRFFEEMDIILLCGVDSANFHPGHIEKSKARKVK